MDNILQAPPNHYFANDDMTVIGSTIILCDDDNKSNYHLITESEYLDYMEAEAAKIEEETKFYREQMQMRPETLI